MKNTEDVRKYAAEQAIYGEDTLKKGMGESSAARSKMSAPKIAQLLFTLRVGTGDCIRTRDRLFAGETVGSFFEMSQGGPC